MKAYWFLATAVALTGCEKPDNAPGPGGVTVGEARALDEAAKMLDARLPPPELSQPIAARWPTGNASDPAATTTDD